MNTVKTTIVIALLAIMVLAYNNCAPGGEPGGASSLEIEAGSCDEALLKTYAETWHPFFRSADRCMNCHIEGGVGLGAFASPEVDKSFASFTGAGLSKISFMATNNQHKPPFTGTQNKPAVDTLSTKWVAAEKQHLACVAKSENGGVDESLLSSAKGAPTIYSAEGATETIVWDLDLAEDLDESAERAIPTRLSVSVKVLYSTIEGKKIAKGYIFSEPTLQMKDDKQTIIIEGIFFQINGQPISSQTTFTSVSKVVTGPVPMLLMKANANTLIEPISTSDRFQVYIRRILPVSANEDAPQPLVPILRLNDKDSGSGTLTNEREVNVLILRDSGILRWCLSESPQRPESTESPCASALPAGRNVINGWSLTRPTRFNLSAGDGVKQLYLWVANDGLKINATAAVAMIGLDTNPPIAPVISSVTVGDTQVAAMSISHSQESDVAGWCVFEQNSVKATPGKPALNNRCWNWTDGGAKPTTVGFKEGGSRDIWVFVKDKAGNVSNASNKMTAVNTHGAITFAQLTSADTNARSVFRNRCFTCHGSGANPGYSKLQLFNYQSALDVADSGVLISRINNVISPMPNVNGGLMPQLERDLIRLWTMPDEGNTPLP